MKDLSGTPKPPINWPTVLFIGGTTLAALCWPFYAWHFGVTAVQIVAAAIYFVVTGLSITVGYHRLVAHRSFKCRPWVKALFLVTGSAAWQGSALQWAGEHVMHHAHTDTDKDPYSIKRGFWYAHVGWLIRKVEIPREEVAEFLRTDPMLELQDRYYTPLAITTGFLIPLALGGVGGLLLAGTVRIVAVHHVTWFINSWAHIGGKRPYRSGLSAADNWLLAFITFGEGWHNYHHAFPSDYRNGVTKLAWDPGKWLIWCLAKIGAAYDLKRVSPAMIWRRRVETALAFDGSESKKQAIVRQTRASLEACARRTEARLLRIARSVPEFHLPCAADLRDLQARLSQQIEAWKTHRDARRVVRLRRAQELGELLAAYRALLERLAAQSVGARATA